MWFRKFAQVWTSRKERALVTVTRWRVIEASHERGEKRQVEPMEPMVPMRIYSHRPIVLNCCSLLRLDALMVVVIEWKPKQKKVDRGMDARRRQCRVGQVSNKTRRTILYEKLGEGGHREQGQRTGCATRRPNRSRLENKCIDALCCSGPCDGVLRRLRLIDNIIGKKEKRGWRRQGDRAACTPCSLRRSTPLPNLMIFLLPSSVLLFVSRRLPSICLSASFFHSRWLAPGEQSTRAKVEKGSGGGGGRKTGSRGEGSREGRGDRQGRVYRPTGVMKAEVDIVWHYWRTFRAKTLQYWFQRGSQTRYPFSSAPTSSANVCGSNFPAQRCGYSIAWQTWLDYHRAEQF